MAKIPVPPATGYDEETELTKLTLTKLTDELRKKTASTRREWHKALNEVDSIVRELQSRRIEEDESVVLDGMIEQMKKSTAQVSVAIDKTCDFVDASNKRIAAMDSAKRSKGIK
jgi:hypothetical protein